MISLLLDSILSFGYNLIAFAVVPFIWWLIFHRKKENPLKFVGLQKPELTQPNWVLAVFLLVYVLYYMFGEKMYVPFMSENTLKALTEGSNVSANEFAGLGTAAIPAAIVTGILVNGFCEELLFRGFILKRFKKLFDGTIAVGITAIVFGLMHNTLLSMSGVPVDMAYHIPTFLFPAIGALLLGYANEKLFNGSIWPSIALHGVGNAISYIIAAYN